MSHSQFSSLLDCFSAPLFQFVYELVSYFPNSVSLISLMSVHQLSNSQFSPCLFLYFFVSWFFSLVSEFPYRSKKCSLPRIRLQFQSSRSISHLNYFRTLLVTVPPLFVSGRRIFFRFFLLFSSCLALGSAR